MPAPTTVHVLFTTAPYNTHVVGYSSEDLACMQEQARGDARFQVATLTGHGAREAACAHLMFCDGVIGDGDLDRWIELHVLIAAGL